MNATLEQIKQAIAQSSKTTKVYVGCDSRYCPRVEIVKFATVVILHIDGKHGGKMFSIVDQKPMYGNVKSPKMRLMMEAQKAIEMAAEIADIIEERPFEVHLDFNINTDYKSSVCVKEATSYVLGTVGFKPKFKPYAFAASTAADRLVQ